MKFFLGDVRNWHDSDLPRRPLLRRCWAKTDVERSVKLTRARSHRRRSRDDHGYGIGSHLAEALRTFNPSYDEADAIPQRVSRLDLFGARAALDQCASGRTNVLDADYAPRGLNQKEDLQISRQVSTAIRGNLIVVLHPRKRRTTWLDGVRKERTGHRAGFGIAQHHCTGR
jgi:hypothetical protein